MSLTVVGLDKRALDTPSLLLDLVGLESNIERIAKRCTECGVDWRPHTKGNKTPGIAHKLIQAGAIGVTCAKLGEAEVMAAAGIRDILVANQIAGTQKVTRLVNLCKQTDVMVSVDHPIHVETISAAARDVGVVVRVLIELDIGMHRAGVAPGEAALELARKAERAEGIRFAGIMGYEGHAMDLPDDEKAAACAEAIGHLADTRSRIEAEGIRVPIVSAGGTGTLAHTPDCPGLTEVQAGGGIMMDTFYPGALGVKGLQQALTILTTVTSRPTADRAIVDAGRKTTDGAFQLPQVLDRKGVSLTALSAEHGNLRLEEGVDLQIGEKIELISGYSDMTVFLHDRIYGTREDRVEVVWEILGRGKLQ